jgi:hypothetical protein
VRTRYVWMGAIALFASMVFADSWAGDHRQPVSTAPASTATSDATALAGSVSGSVSHATGGTSSASGVGVGGSSAATVTGVSATGGTANGGAGGSGGAGGDADASADASNRNALVNQTLVERSVGALVMGTVIPVDCGFGGQAGGADRNGSGFLGLTWTTDKCYTLKAATAWAAMGEYELACEMLVDVTKKALKRRHRIPDCTVIGLSLRMAHDTREPVVINTQSLLPLTPTAPPANYVTPEQMREYVDRAFRKTVGK